MVVLITQNKISYLMNSESTELTVYPNSLTRLQISFQSITRIIDGIREQSLPSDVHFVNGSWNLRQWDRDPG